MSDSSAFAGFCYTTALEVSVVDSGRTMSDEPEGNPSSNPYATPQHDTVAQVTEGTQAPSFLAVMIVVSLATAAAGISFFCTCLGVLAVQGLEGAGPEAIAFCVVAAFAGFVLASRMGLAVTNGLHGGKNVQISWWWLLLGGVISVGSFLLLSIAIPPMLSVILSAAVNSFFIWRVHESAAERERTHAT